MNLVAGGITVKHTNWKKSRPTGIVLPTLKHPPLPGAIVLPRRTDTSSCVALMYSDVWKGKWRKWQRRSPPDSERLEPSF